MKLLLDECLPRRLKNLFTAHEVRTVPEMGWHRRRNGDLLRMAAAEFDVFVTADQSLQYQQNLAGVDIGIIVFAAHSTHFDDLSELVPAALQALESIHPGDVIRITA